MPVDTLLVCFSHFVFCWRDATNAILFGYMLVHVCLQLKISGTNPGKLFCALTCVLSYDHYLLSVGL